MSEPRILLVEDESAIRLALSGLLKRAGFEIEQAASGDEALARLASEDFDFVLTDLALGEGASGMDVLRVSKERQPETPVVMITAHGNEKIAVEAMKLGADDYVPKPFSPRELLARIRAVLRRTQPEVTSERIAIGGVEVDVGARSAKVEGTDVELTGLELDILVALMRRAGRVVPRDALLSEAGRDDVVVSERTVDVHISHLRKKLGDDPKTPALIRTVRGVGYVFVRDTA